MLNRISYESHWKAVVYSSELYKEMGQINDKRGLEQGAVNSDRFYKLCNNSQLKEAQQSHLCVAVIGTM